MTNLRCFIAKKTKITGKYLQDWGLNKNRAPILLLNAWVFFENVLNLEFKIQVSYCIEK